MNRILLALMFSVGTALAAPPVHATLDDVALEALLEDDDWSIRQQAALVLGQRHHPELYTSWAEAEPVRTRSGFLRFAGPQVDDARLAPLFLERLVHGDEPPAVRAALAEVLPRTGGDWSEAAAALATTEADPDVRAILVAVLRRAEAGPALDGLHKALGDPDPHVRAEAARAIGWRPDGAALADALLPLLADPHAEPRTNAARALGWLQVRGAFDPLAAGLTDPDPTVRLTTLRAMERLDAPRLATLPQLTDLVADPDPRVARAASGISASHR